MKLTNSQIFANDNLNEYDFGKNYHWIRPRALNREVPGSNLLAATVATLAMHFIIIA